MNKGVEILLARMDSHPEEFSTNAKRWDREIRLILDKSNMFTDEERQVVHEKLTLLRRDGFTNEVMKKLVDGWKHGL